MATGDKVVKLDGLKAVHDKVIDKITNLGNTIESPDQIIGVTWTEGTMIEEDGTENSTDSGHQYMMCTGFIPVVAGRTYTVTFTPHINATLENMSHFRVHGYTDDDNAHWVRQVAIANRDNMTADTPYSLTFAASEISYVRFSCRKNYTDVHLRRTIDDIVKEKAEARFMEISGADDQPNLLTGVSWTAGKKISISGSPASASAVTDAAYHYTALITVTPGKRYTLTLLTKAGCTLKDVTVDGYDGSNAWVKRLRIVPAADQTAGAVTVEDFYTESCVKVRLSVPNVTMACVSKLNGQAECELQTLYTKSVNPTWEAGRYSVGNGTKTNYNEGDTGYGMYIRTASYADLSAEIIRAENLKITMLLWNRDGTFLGGWNGTPTPVTTLAAQKWYTAINVREVYDTLKASYPDLLYKLVAKRPGGTTDKDTDGALVHNYCKQTMYGSVGLYKTWAVIGASSDSGFYVDSTHADGTSHHDYAWPEVLARMMGNTVYNYAKSGQTLDGFITGTGDYCLTKLLADDPWDLYVITLGGNDATQSTASTDEEIAAWIGTTDDCHDDTKTTFCAYYGQILDAIIEHAAGAKIVLTTPPGVHYNKKHKAADNAIKAIAAAYELPFIAWESDEYMRSNVFINNMDTSGHAIKPSNGGKAYAFERLFSRAVAENPAYFA